MDMLTRAKWTKDGTLLEIYGRLASRLLRAYTEQAQVLAKLKRGGEQTVRVEHVHVHASGQAVVGNVNHRGGGNGKDSSQPDAQCSGGAALRAKTRGGPPCKGPATPKGRCRKHGGAPGSGAPTGPWNGNYRHGAYTREMMDTRRLVRELLKRSTL